MREIKFRAWDAKTQSMADWKLLTHMIEGDEIRLVESIKPYKTGVGELISGVVYRGNPFTHSSLTLKLYLKKVRSNNLELAIK